jgi:hypothetical protein
LTIRQDGLRAHWIHPFVPLAIMESNVRDDPPYR